VTKLQSVVGLTSTLYKSIKLLAKEAMYEIKPIQFGGRETYLIGHVVNTTIVPSIFLDLKKPRILS